MNVNSSLPGAFLMPYPWTVIPVERRNEYMAALEAASVNGEIAPFVEFIAGLVNSDNK